MIARVLALAMMLALASAQGAPLTEEEKKLLTSGISADGAMEMGKIADAAGFERIIALGDPQLVYRFSGGLDVGRVGKMPASIEALVVKHFDDPRVGVALRDLSPRYQTRALFDRYYARMQSTYKADDPVFRQILRNDVPGVEKEILAASSRFPTPSSGEVNPAIAFAASRKSPAAVPALVAAIGPAFRAESQYNAAVSLLLQYDSPDVWRQASAEIERLAAKGGVPEKALAFARQQMEPMLADPQAAIARRKGGEARAEFRKRQLDLSREAPDRAKLRDDPRRYVEEQQRYLARLDAIADEFKDEGVTYEVANEHANLGIYARMRTRDLDTAIRHLEQAAQGRSLLGQVALADTYQLERHDKAAALRAYQRALDTATETGKAITPYAQPRSTQNTFWVSWLTAEIAYLQSGTPFRDRIPETAITGFWDVQRVWRRSIAPAYAGWPVELRVVRTQSSPGYSGMALGAQYASSWSEIGAEFAVAADLGDPAKLRALPASRLTMMMTLAAMSAMRDPQAMLAEFARHDPSGYWTTIALGTIAFHEGHGRDGALSDGVAEAMPGMGAPGSPNALAKAAQAFLQSRTLRVVEKK